MFANKEKFRKLTGITVSEISDEDLQTMIPFADKAVMRLASAEVYDEKLTGNIDGSNVIFTTAKKPIADMNLDRQVTSSDVSVFLASNDPKNNRVSAAATVSSVNARDGIITLSSAPNTTNAESGVFADYRYYRNAKIDLDIMEEASIYYLAFLVYTRNNESTANWSGISDTIVAKLIGGASLGAGKERIVGKKWLDLCLRVLRSIRAVGSGKVANKKVDMTAHRKK